MASDGVTYERGDPADTQIRLSTWNALMDMLRDWTQGGFRAKVGALKVPPPRDDAIYTTVVFNDNITVDLQYQGIWPTVPAFGWLTISGGGIDPKSEVTLAGGFGSTTQVIGTPNSSPFGLKNYPYTQDGTTGPDMGSFAGQHAYLGSAYGGNLPTGGPLAISYGANYNTIVIAQSPIGANKVGPAIIQGETPVRLRIRPANPNVPGDLGGRYDQWARAVGQDVTQLYTDPYSGHAKILWMDDKANAIQNPLLDTWPSSIDPTSGAAGWYTVWGRVLLTNLPERHSDCGCGCADCGGAGGTTTTTGNGGVILPPGSGGTIGTNGLPCTKCPTGQVWFNDGTGFNCHSGALDCPQGYALRPDPSGCGYSCQPVAQMPTYGGQTWTNVPVNQWITTSPTRTVTLPSGGSATVLAQHVLAAWGPSTTMPVLMMGELAYQTDTGKLIVGLGPNFTPVTIGPSAGSGPAIVASADLTARTATVANVLTCTDSGSGGIYSVGALLTVTAATGQNVTTTITWTDPHSTSQSNNMFGPSASSIYPSGPGTGSFPLTDNTISVKAGTNIVVATTVGGLGTITYDISVTITKIR